MNVEQLLSLLHEAGLDDKGIKDLLTETIATLPADDEVATETEEASKLLGVKI